MDSPAYTIILALNLSVCFLDTRRYIINAKIHAISIAIVTGFSSESFEKTDCRYSKTDIKHPLSKSGKYTHWGDKKDKRKLFLLAHNEPSLCASLRWNYPTGSKGRRIYHLLSHNSSPSACTRLYLIVYYIIVKNYEFVKLYKSLIKPYKDVIFTFSDITKLKF